jgi:hypothetical protein
LAVKKKSTTAGPPGDQEFLINRTIPIPTSMNGSNIAARAIGAMTRPITAPMNPSGKTMKITNKTDNSTPSILNGKVSMYIVTCMKTAIIFNMTMVKNIISKAAIIPTGHSLG